MRAVCKIVETCRIVSLCARQPVYSFHTKFKLNVPASKVFTNQTFFSNISVRKMAQKSITSFFKITPKKLAETPVEEEKLASSHDEDSPIKKNNEKRTSKRQRLDSSDGEMAEAASVTNETSSEKKKKTKRQRIESSGSESETKPNNDLEPVIQKRNGPIKTYSSPKSSKKKVKKESPAAKDRKSPKVKEEKKSPEKIVNGNRKSGSPVQNGNASSDKKEIPSPKTSEEVSPKETHSPKDVKVKEEKKTPKSKKDSKKDVSEQKETKDKVAKDNTDVKGDAGIVAEVEYNPAKAKYQPVTDACWSKGQAVPYLALARTLEAIEATSARLKMIDILANYFRSVIALTPEDLLPSVYMCLNQLAPAYQSLELGIAETYLMKAIGQCTGRTLAQVRAAAQKTGDLGQVAESARATQRTMFTPAPLTARGVFSALRDIARMTGQASINKKISKIQTLYVACRHSEAKFLIRSLEGKLRIGLAEQSVLQALAVAATATPPAADGDDLVLDASKGVPPDDYKKRVEENALTIKTTYCECPDYERLVPALLQHGVAGLPQRCRLAPGTPLKPMLAHPTRGVHEVFNRFEGCQFTCEWKYDGERAQIHVPGEDQPDLTKAAIFSRNQENNTSKYPDVLRRLPSLLKDSVSSCVLDCEAVAYDVVNKQILPFQVLSTRKRKEASEAEIKVQVCVFVFDVLFLNSRPLVREPLAARRRLLREHFHEVPGEWEFARSQDCSSMEEVQAFLEEAVKGSCEGLMVKTLEGDAARYDIARRSRNWLKLKKDYLEGVGDTIDVVVIGAYRGRGKRAGVFGGFLLACHDRDGDQYQSLCKIGTGFSDQDLAALSDRLAAHEIAAPRNYYRYEPSHAPDVWLAPASVWEIRCADLSLSPAHHAAIGLVDADKGISLRFPRFIREREDKTPEQATSAQQIAEMYLAQDQVRNQASTKQVNHDDFY